MSGSSLLFSRLLITGALATVVGCTIPFAPQPDRQTNDCQVASDCGADSTCVLLEKGATCVSTKADLSGLFFEVLPAAGAGFGAGTSYLLDPAEQGVMLQSTINGAVSFNPTLPALVSITPGEVICIADKTTIPAKVAFRRLSFFAGLPEKTYAASAQKEGDGPDAPFSFHIDVPPGNYSIYIEPESPALCGGVPLPPAFIPIQPISGNTTFSLALQPARHLTGEIGVPDKSSLNGWSLQVVELMSGRLISETQTFDQKGGSAAQIDLHYNLTDGIAPLLRLKPPADVIAPTVYWDLAALDLQGSNVVMLALSDLTIAPRDVEGHVLSADESATPVIASVTLQSIGLSGDTFKNAAYTVTAETDEDGLFKVKVPPGKYRVSAEALNDESKARAETEWNIQGDLDSCFCGQVVTLPNKAVLEGEVITPTQGPLLTSNIVASPSLPPPISQLDRELGRTKLLPRGASASVSNGVFAFGVDYGEFDFSVQPPAESGYPWLVRSRLTVLPGSDEQSSSVGTISIAHPFVVTGTIRDPFGEVVPLANIRAWLPVKVAEGLTGTVIQIAGTTTDTNGTYTLLLPPSISQ